MARVPKIKSGAVNGKTSKPTIVPPRRKLTVNAAPSAISTLSVGVASTKAPSMIGSDASGIEYDSAKMGTSAISGRIVIEPVSRDLREHRDADRHRAQHELLEAAVVRIAAKQAL